MELQLASQQVNLQRCATERFDALCLEVRLVNGPLFGTCYRSRMFSRPAFTCRKNQLLEEASVTMQEEQDRLQHQASSLADRLHAVMEEKRHRRLSFDAETPVDKTLNYLQSVVSVSICAGSVFLCLCTHDVSCCCSVACINLIAYLVPLLWQGITPSVEVALELFNMLSRSDTKLRQPVGLETQLLQDMRMDSDVSRSMLQLLQV